MQALLYSLRASPKMENRGNPSMKDRGKRFKSIQVCRMTYSPRYSPEEDYEGGDREGGKENGSRRQANRSIFRQGLKG